MSKLAKNLHKCLRMTDFATRASRLVSPFCLCISHKSSRFAPRASQFLSNSLSYLRVRASRLAPYSFRVNEMKKVRASRLAHHTFPPPLTFIPKVRASRLAPYDFNNKPKQIVRVSRLATRIFKFQLQSKHISSRLATRTF